VVSSSASNVARLYLLAFLHQNLRNAAAGIERQCYLALGGDVACSAHRLFDAAPADRGRGGCASRRGGLCTTAARPAPNANRATSTATTMSTRTIPPITSAFFMIRFLHGYEPGALVRTAGCCLLTGTAGIHRHLL